MHEYKGVSRYKFHSRYNQFPEDVFGATLANLSNLGLLSISDEWISLSLQGFLFADEICTEFYSDEVKKKITKKGGHRYGMNYIGKDYDTSS